MHLHVDCREVTVFVTPWGHYQWTVFPMGIKKGPALFQRMVNWAIQTVSHCARAYVDDIQIGSKYPVDSKTGLVKQHFDDVCCVLQAFRNCKLTVKGEKVHLFKTVITFCGQVLSQGKRRAAPSKLTAIPHWTPDMVRTVTHLKGFMGLAQYYA